MLDDQENITQHDEVATVPQQDVPYHNVEPSFPQTASHCYVINKEFKNQQVADKGASGESEPRVESEHYSQFIGKNAFNYSDTKECLERNPDEKVELDQYF